MAPNSSSSSMEARNGSLYCNGSYATSIADARNPPQQQHSYSSADASTRHDRSAVPNESSANVSTTNHYTESYASIARDTSYEHHDFPADNFETPLYENEFSFEGDQNTTAASQDTPQDGYTEQAPTHSHGFQNEQSNQTNGGPSPTQRWYDEHSSEERLRLGLPRYETEEQQRQAYQAASDYESHEAH